MAKELQKRHDEKRKLYMDGKLTHQEFYSWLAEEIGISIGNLPVTLDRVRESQDSALNDISLHKWDGEHGTVARLARDAGMRSWSLSDSVCCLKAFARKAAGKAEVR